MEDVFNALGVLLLFLPNKDTHRSTVSATIAVMALLAAALDEDEDTRLVVVGLRVVDNRCRMVVAVWWGEVVGEVASVDAAALAIMFAQCNIN
jgi:hypothetical protein